MAFQVNKLQIRKLQSKKMLLEAYIETLVCTSLILEQLWQSVHKLTQTIPYTSLSTVAFLGNAVVQK